MPQGEAPLVRMRKMPTTLFLKLEGSPPMLAPAPVHPSACISAKFVHRRPHKRSEFKDSTKKLTTKL